MDSLVNSPDYSYLQANDVLGSFQLRWKWGHKKVYFIAQPFGFIKALACIH